jgi:DNA polymerase phi
MFSSDEDSENTGGEEVGDSDNDHSASSDSDDSEDTNNEDEDPELRNKIEALYVDGAGSNIGESGEDSEQVMNDDQMMAVDEQLAEIFRSRPNRKGRKGCPSLSIRNVTKSSDPRHGIRTWGYPFQKPSS